MPQLSRALASEPSLAAHLLGPLCAVISGHRSTRLHHEIPALRKPSSSSSRKSPLTARYQPLVYSRIVGNPYLGIISGLPVTRPEFGPPHLSRESPDCFSHALNWGQQYFGTKRSHTWKYVSALL